MASNAQVDFHKIVTDGTGAQRWLESIHRNKCAGARIICRVMSDGKVDKTVSSGSIPSCVQFAHDNDSVNRSIYATINDFWGNTNDADSLFSVNGIYIDLDWHSVEDNSRAKFIEKAIKKLNEAFMSGQLALPTAITMTGRGMGIFYVLTRNISAQGRTDKMLGYLDDVNELLTRKFIKVLKGTRCQVDMGVKDRSRIARIPDTNNPSSGTVCRLVDYDGPTYTLGKLFNACKLKQYYRGKSKEAHTDPNESKTDNMPQIDVKDRYDANTGFIKHLMLNRMEYMERYVDYMNESGVEEGYREEVLFIYYNSAVQVMDRDEAKEATRELNKRFIRPLPPSTVKQAFSPDRTEKGYYHLTNSYIRSFLGPADDVEFVLDAKKSAKEAKRAAKKEATRLRKLHIKEVVFEQKKKHSKIKRGELLQIVNRQLIEDGIKAISLSTLDRITRLKDKNETDQTFDEIREMHEKQDKDSHKYETKNEPAKKVVKKCPRVCFSRNNVEMLVPVKVAVAFTDAGMVGVYNNLCELAFGTTWSRESGLIRDMFVFLGEVPKKDVKRFVRVLRTTGSGEFSAIEDAFYCTFGCSLDSAYDMARTKYLARKERGFRYINNQRLWHYIRVHSHDSSSSPLSYICRLYQRINRYCKAKAGSIFKELADGTVWTCNFIKRKVLYLADIQDLEAVTSEYSYQLTDVGLITALIQREVADGRLVSQ